MYVGNLGLSRNGCELSRLIRSGCLNHIKVLSIDRFRHISNWMNFNREIILNNKMGLAALRLVGSNMAPAPKNYFQLISGLRR